MSTCVGGWETRHLTWYSICGIDMSILGYILKMYTLCGQ